MLSIGEKNDRTQVTLIIVRRNDPRYPFKIAIGHKLIEKQSIAPGTKGIDPHRASSKRELTRSTMYSTIHTELLCHETGVVGIVRVTTVQRGNIVLNLYGNSWMIIARWCPYAAALLLLILLYVFVILFLEDTRSKVVALYRIEEWIFLNVVNIKCTIWLNENLKKYDTKFFIRRRCIWFLHLSIFIFLFVSSFFNEKLEISLRNLYNINFLSLMLKLKLLWIMFINTN